MKDTATFSPSQIKNQPIPRSTEGPMDMLKLQEATPCLKNPRTFREHHNRIWSIYTIYTELSLILVIDMGRAWKSAITMSVFEKLNDPGDSSNQSYPSTKHSRVGILLCRKNKQRLTLQDRVLTPHEATRDSHNPLNLKYSIGPRQYDLPKFILI